MDMEEHLNSIGRAKTVLVFGDEQNAVGVISAITAHASDEILPEPACFSGPVSFSDSAISHIKEIILPIISNILKILDIPKKSFKISLVNLNAASAMDIGMDISGFSADVPIFLALLSSGLQISLPGDIVSTGLIASLDGDIRLVRNIPAKIKVAVSDPSIQKFVFPGIESDISLDILSPNQRDEITEAIINAREEIRTVSGNSIKDLLKAVLTDEAIVMAALRAGFFIEKNLSNKHRDSIIQCGRAQQITMKNSGRQLKNTCLKEMIKQSGNLSQHSLNSI